MTQDTATRSRHRDPQDTARTAMNVSDIRTQERPTETARDDGVVLRLDSVDKHYPGVHAIKNVSLDGAPRRGPRPGRRRTAPANPPWSASPPGRSTPTRGRSRSVASPPATPSPQWCREQGLAIVYQEPALLAGSDRRREHAPEHARTAPAHGGRPDRVGADRSGRWSSVAAIDPRTPVRELAPDARFVVEIAKALAEEPKVIVLDEPTEHLLPAAVDRTVPADRRTHRRRRRGRLHLASPQRGQTDRAHRLGAARRRPGRHLRRRRRHRAGRGQPRRRPRTDPRPDPQRHPHHADRRTPAAGRRPVRGSVRRRRR